jgi:DNA-binding NarL/FixJ family response regulator
VPIRCLVVDDQPEFLETVRHLLDRQGISVVGVAANSAEAMKRAADLRPELASRIAAHRQAGSPHVILISTYPKDDLAGALPTGSSIPFVSKTDLSATMIRTALGLPPDDESTG